MSGTPNLQSRQARVATARRLLLVNHASPASGHGYRFPTPPLPVLRPADALQAHSSEGQSGFRLSHLRVQLVRRRAQRLAGRRSLAARYSGGRFAARVRTNCGAICDLKFSFARKKIFRAQIRERKFHSEVTLFLLISR